MTAKGGNRAAGIGGGYQADGGSITINGGTVNATGTYKAAGIGGGFRGGSGSITITGGNIQAVPGDYNGNLGSPIGAGNSGANNAPVITGGNFTVGDTSAKTVYGCAVGTTDSPRFVQYNNVGWPYPYAVVKQMPTAANLSFAAPQNLVFDGTAKKASVATVSGTSGLGAINVKYYNGTGAQVDGAPVDAGTYTVKADVAEGDLYAAATGITLGTFSITKATPVLAITPNSGEATVPDATTFDATVSAFYDGSLEVTCDRPEVADASISDGTVTVAAKRAGAATVTVTAPETNNCNAATATYMVTVKSGKISAVSPNDTTAVYDGQPHQAGYVTVSAPNSGYTVAYGTQYGVYDLAEAPSYTDAGTYRVYWQAAADGYETLTGSWALTIEKATPVITLAPASGETTVPDTTTFDVSASDFYDGALEVSSDKPEVAGTSLSNGTVMVTAKRAGTAAITVTAPATANCKAASATYTVTVKSGTIAAAAPSDTTLAYDGQPHQAGYVSVSAPTSGYTVMYGTREGVYDLAEAPSCTDAGTYRIYWQATADDYETLTGSWTLTIEKATPVLAITPNSGEATVPDATTFDVSVSDLYDGVLEVACDRPEAADVSFAGGTVMVTAKRAGITTITVTAPATDNYEAATATYTLTVKSGTIAAAAPSDTTVVYDGKPHQAGRVSVGAPATGYTVAYGTQYGVYDLTEAPSYTDAGTYRVYWQVTADGYETLTGSWTLTIEKTAPVTPITPTTSAAVTPSVESAVKDNAPSTASSHRDPMPQSGDETNPLLPLAIAVLGTVVLLAGVVTREHRALAAHLRR